AQTGATNFVFEVRALPPATLPLTHLPPRHPRRLAPHFLVHAPIHKALELPGPDRVLELADRLGLDLSHALARHLENAADLLEGVGVAIADAVAELDDLPLAVGQRPQHLLDPLLEHVLGRGLAGHVLPLILDEVAEVAVLALTDRSVERHRMAADLHHA